MGILFVQTVPNKKYMQILNIFVVSFLFLMQEYILLLTKVAQYINWHILASLYVDVLAFSSLTWFATVFLKDASAAKVT